MGSLVLGGFEMKDVLLDSMELAQILRVHPATIRTWRHRNQGPPFIRVGRNVRYSRGDLDDWLARNTVQPNGKSEEEREAIGRALGYPVESVVGIKTSAAPR